MGRRLGALKAAIFFSAFGMFVSPSLVHAACAPDRVIVATSKARQEFTVEVADTEAKRAQGLMNRPHLASAAGMLFIYPNPQHAQFWMANTQIPLDMIFAGEGGAILSIHSNAVPLDRSVIDGGQGVRYVLEINGGLAGRLGIAVGGALHHPAIAGSECAAP